MYGGHVADETQNWKLANPCLPRMVDNLYNVLAGIIAAGPSFYPYGLDCITMIDKLCLKILQMFYQLLDFCLCNNASNEIKSCVPVKQFDVGSILHQIR